MTKVHQTAARFVFVVLGICCSALCGAERSSGVARLFETGTKNTPTAVATARAQYDELKKANPKDARVDYAYGLALANQRRCRDSVPLVSRYVESAPTDLAAWRVRIWVQVQDKRYVKALDDCVAVGGAIPKEVADQPDREVLETARFLGTIFGYLELARPGIVDAQHSLARKNEVLAALSEGYLKAFDEGREAVATQVAELEAQRDAERKQVTAAAEQAKQHTRAALEADKQKIADQTDAMQTNDVQLQDANRELTVLRNQLQSLQQDRTRLSAEIVKTQTELAMLTEPQTTSRVVERTRPGNPFPARATVTETQAISPSQYAQASAAAMRLAVLNKQAFDIDRRILALQSRGQEVGGTRHKERLALEKGRETVRQVEKHAKLTEQRLRRTGPSSTARATVLAAKMASFSTYAPFPFEEEKERVLSWFAK